MKKQDTNSENLGDNNNSFFNEQNATQKKGVTIKQSAKFQGFGVKVEVENHITKDGKPEAPSCRII